MICLNETFSKFQPVEILKHGLQRECQNVVKKNWPSWKIVIVWLKPYFLSMDGSGGWYASKTPSLRRWHMAIIRSVSSGSSDTGAARSSTYVAFSLSLLGIERICYACLPTEYFVLIALAVLLKRWLMTPWWHRDKTRWPVAINPRF